jgi:hypothetical protein
METLLRWIFDLIPFGIATFAVCIVKGWILIRPADREFSYDWRKKHRGNFVLLAVITSLAGICALLVEAGIVRTHP